jgi:predicted transcriptional regulator of viral defense system
MKNSKKSLANWIDGRQQQGQYTFTRDKVKERQEVNDQTLTKSLQRLTKAGRIQQIRRGFYTIIPMEYRRGNGLPATWYIDDLMRYMEIDYYVGVLSAAALHGAAHQQPQEFQVVIPRFLKPIDAGRVRISFFQKTQLQQVIVQKKKTYTGYIPVSEPVSTALDLLRFNRRIGGLDAVMTVLSELAEEMTPVSLVEECRTESDRSLVQRLGWMLDNLNTGDLTEPLSRWINHVQPSKVKLDPSEPYLSGKLDHKWKLVVNSHPESDV